MDDQEYFVVEAIRQFAGVLPAVFYYLIRSDGKLRDTLNRKRLKTLSQYMEFDKKRFETYALDTTMVEVDLNIRRGKKIKQGYFDSDFVFDSSWGTIVEFTVAVLVNLSNMIVIDVKIYPKKIWGEMVLNLGTENDMHIWKD